MNNFRVSSYELQAQRHIYPLYMADGRGGYEFSSTMTFLRRRNESFCVFAAHALDPRSDDIDKIGVFSTDGEFKAISEYSIAHKICRKRDLVACRTSAPFEYKNYFDLDAVKSSSEWVEGGFGWIGFPKKKAVEKIHCTKSNKEQLQKYLVDGEQGSKKWTNAEFLLLGAEMQSETDQIITGVFENKDVNYTHAGFKSNGYSLRGMSGGALFRGPNKINTDPPCLNDYFDFIGIGLEYDNREVVRGASRAAVKELLDEVLSWPV
ncbi:hypothetical protein [Idiomarina xiamenensis]|uniref:Uncharacterized protein n=1 Tax=Idiomarina xiamenensis 10-D-4 TaxID=740709 RepID=K2JJ36_9GAMM|nr:hypothetical protein [Idiomarina xiamenensis]EKE83436.1 hypothetical protein A10D4_08442 [Idiomarina xiamenensis 10-D-4]